MASSLFGEQNKQPKKAPMSEAVAQARQAMQNNAPIVSMVKALCGQRSPKEVFYAACQEQGVNPDDILSMIR